MKAHRLIASLTIAFAAVAPAEGSQPIIAGPSYAGMTNGGYQAQPLPLAPSKVAGNGFGVAAAYGRPQFSPAGTPDGSYLFRMNAATSAAQRLEGLPLQPGAAQFSYVHGANATGAAVGHGSKVSPSNTDVGLRPIRWSASSTLPTELGTLGLGNTIYGEAAALGINASEVAVGWSDKEPSGSGERAVRWNAGTSVPTELGNLGLHAGGFAISKAIAINDAGVAIGFATKPDVNDGGDRPVRWNAGSTTATELSVFSKNSEGTGYAYTHAISATGHIVGYGKAMNPLPQGLDFGTRAARWAAGGTVVSELGHLGLDASGRTNAEAFAVGKDGTAVGVVEKYDPAGVFMGKRAVRWDAGSSVAIELANLGVAADGGTSTSATSISDTGIIAGTAAKYNLNGVYGGDVAVVWLPDGSILDLNTLLAPGSGWFLRGAHSISSTNWVVGHGIFQANQFFSYERVFMMQVPEPSGIIAVLPIVLALGRRTAI